MSADGAPAEGDGSTPGRVIAVLALIVAFAFVGWLLFAEEDGYEYRLMFQTGGQLVPGNQVLIGGQPVGTIESIELTEDAQAAVNIKVDRQLPAGTEATIRLTSLSGVANRYVALAPGPGTEMLDEGTTISGEKTTSPVDLDQLFNVFRKSERNALSRLIKGQGAVYAGKGKQANRTYRFLNPAFSATERLLAELNRDERVLERFLVEGAGAVGAIADRRDDLSSLVANTEQALGAIAAENDALDRTLVSLPATMRQANTTFVNLRAALDDLDPLVADSKRATRDLAPFLRKTRPVVRDAIPVFGDLADVVAPSGTQRILSDLPTVDSRARKTVPRAITALDDYQPVIEFARPYAPELLGVITKLGQLTAYYDANGHYARVSPAGANIFDYDAATGRLDPTYSQPERQYDFYKNTPGALGTFLRCPGAATQANAGWPAPTDHPFLDDGRLGPDDCDPSDILPGMPANP